MERYPRIVQRPTDAVGELSSPGHIALECDAETQQGLRERLEANGLTVRVTDPNNLRLDFTVDHPEVERINTDQLAHAHESLQRWLSGHHTPNNDFHLH